MQFYRVYNLIIADFGQFWSISDLLSHIAQNLGDTPPGLFTFSYTRMLASYYVVDIRMIATIIGALQGLYSHFWSNFAIFQNLWLLVGLDEIFSTWTQYKSCFSHRYE